MFTCGRVNLKDTILNIPAAVGKKHETNCHMWNLSHPPGAIEKSDVC